MPDNSKKFHEFALQSILFKGRQDWYFCYLKSEKIAHVLAFLCEQVLPESRGEIEEATRRAALLPGEIAHLAAGEVDAEVVLADLFALLSALRMLAARRILAPEHGALLARELEGVAERLVRGSHPSPLLLSEHFAIPSLEAPAPQLPRGPFESASSAIKDNSRAKGHAGSNKGQSDRMSLILELVRKRKSLSIKEIAKEIKDCSEKTIQRELQELIRKGLIRKVGERRWSLYLPA